jgi:histone H3/H4
MAITNSSLAVSSADAQRMVQYKRTFGHQYNPAWPRKAIHRLIREIEHHDVRSGNDFFVNKAPLKWKPETLDCLSFAAESYMIRVFQQAEAYAQLAGMITTLGNHVRMAGYVQNRKVTRPNS